MNRSPENRPTGAFRVAGALVIGLILALLTFSAIDEIGFARDRLGIDLAADDQGLLVTDVEPGLPAERAGLRPGDILIGINGQPSPSFQALDQLVSAHVDRSKPLDLEILRTQARLHVDLTPGVAPDIAGLLAQLVLVAAYLGLAILAARYRHDDPRARLLMLFVALIAMELALPAGYTLSHGLLQAMILFWLMATGIQIALELHLVSLIPNRLPLLRHRAWLVPVYYAVGVLIGLGLCALTVLEWQGHGDSLPIFLANAESLVLTLWALAIAALLVYQAWRAQDPRGRQQALLVLIGLLPWAAYILVSVFWSGWSDLHQGWAEQIENLVLLFFPAAIFLAIFRYGLFDVENLVRRSLVYGAVAGLVLILLYTLLTATRPWLTELAGEQIGIWLVTGLAVMIGILFRPLRNSIERLVERGLFPERRALRHRLIQIASGLSNHDEMAELVQRLAEETQRALKLDWVAVTAIDDSDRRHHHAASQALAPSSRLSVARLLGSGSPVFSSLAQIRRPISVRRLGRRQAEAAQALDAMGAEMLVPLYIQARMIGILCLSQKHSGELFTREEVELLDLFSHQIAASFENLRLFKDAHYERLTGLMRREAALRQLDIEFEHTIRNGHPLSVLMIDLDHFKSVNDTHGHLFGDEVIRQVAGAMQDCVRSADALGRYGGEEFLLVLPNTDAHGALKLAEKLRRAVSSLRFHPAEGQSLGVTVSIGIASLEADRPDTPKLANTLLADADRALYRAKSSGRNRIVSDTNPNQSPP